MKKILIINGPNLNFLGIREKEIYGTENYSDICDYIKLEIHKLYNKEEKQVDILFFQSNHEGILVDMLQQAYFDKIDGIIINPGALTHYSYSLHDAVKSTGIPTIEVHLSDIKSREEFRKHSVVSPACVHQIYGQGKEGYVEAVKYLFDKEFKNI